MTSVDFPPTRTEALQRLGNIDLPAYARTRNHLRGRVTRLSPYLTHGLITVSEVLDAIGDPNSKRAQELAWREFFSLVHRLEGSAIFRDRFRTQPRRRPEASPQWLPRAILEATTGVKVLDEASERLQQRGYLHNQERLALASVTTHGAGADWRAGAAWFFYHLLDGDLASNALSWQWVAGSGSSKPYLTRQGLLNAISDHDQRGTFLDQPGEALLENEIPAALQEPKELNLSTPIPQGSAPELDPATPLLLYHPWGLDPTWRAGEHAQRLLLMEPALLQRHPLSPTRIAWIEAAASGIPGLKIAYLSPQEALAGRSADAAPVRHRDHPAVRHWRTLADPQPLAFAQRWPHPHAPRSFTAFWKAVATPTRP